MSRSRTSYNDRAYYSLTDILRLTPNINRSDTRNGTVSISGGHESTVECRFFSNRKNYVHSNSIEVKCLISGLHV